jgi:hypothetical protein
MYNPAQAFIHIAKSLKTYRTSQNLSKSMSAPTLKNEKKIKHENTTMCIVHSTLRDATTPYTERNMQVRKKKITRFTQPCR